MRYDDFKKLAEKKRFVMLSEYNIKSYVVTKFEIWISMDDNTTIIAELMGNGEVVIFKETDKL
jgi:hypothetical protein